MAEITISGSADELEPAMRELADQQRKESERIEREIANQPPPEPVPEPEPDIVVVEQENPMADFDFGTAFKELGDRLESMIDQRVPKPSDDEVKSRRLAELRAELATLSPDDPTNDPTVLPSAGPGVGPQTPPRKAAKSSASGKADTAEGESEDSDDGGSGRRPRRAWSWY